MSAPERLRNARALLATVHDELDRAAGELPDLEAHAARELRGDVQEVQRRVANLLLFAERAKAS
ncbi:MAG TPA: hypothetical protein VMM35_03770 [Longimicrobiales bacterium]|nr:hypothetical protein [Longimicrobiales bacterium]